ncbi:MAG: MarR family transcriptional regulator [Synergistaceae bacterium]|nr:MarR family transcriptional regulator [Synergistaceae bacterium]
MESRIKEADLRAILELSDIWRRYDQVYSRWAEMHGLSTNAMSLLEELHRSPLGMEPAMIADYLGVPRQTMTSTLDTLEKRGIIERQPHPTDRRRKVIRFTEEGAEMADKLINDLHRWEMNAISAIPARERGRLLAAVRGFCERLEATL